MGAVKGTAGSDRNVFSESRVRAKRRVHESRVDALTDSHHQPASWPLSQRVLICRRREPDYWRVLRAFREQECGGEFYLACLEYGHSLWLREFAARAILCLDRAFGANLQSEEPVLKPWPLPYAAMAWFIRHTPDGVFLGNPRVHFQHYAGRMNEPRAEQRRCAPGPAGRSRARFARSSRAIHDIL